MLSLPKIAKAAAVGTVIPANDKAIWPFHAHFRTETLLRLENAAVLSHGRVIGANETEIAVLEAKPSEKPLKPWSIAFYRLTGLRYFGEDKQLNKVLASLRGEAVEIHLGTDFDGGNLEHVAFCNKLTDQIVDAVNDAAAGGIALKMPLQWTLGQRALAAALAKKLGIPRE